VPTASVGFTGVTVIDCSTAEVTTKLADLERDARLAEMVALPGAAPFAKPLLLMVATVPSDEIHVTVLVMSWLDPSLNVPVAVNCWGTPAGTVALLGLTAIAVRTALVMVTVLLLLIVAVLAEMVTLPRPTEITKPVLSIVAIFGSDEVHVTEERVCVLPSVNKPTAAIWVLVPSASDGEGGMNEIDTRAAGNTVRIVVPVTEPDSAVIVTAPVPTVVAIPELSIVATAGSEELHVTAARFAEDPSLNKPVALKACVNPRGIEG